VGFYFADCFSSMVRQIIIISFFISFSSLWMQGEIAFAQDPYASTGVARYIHPTEPHFRALFGIGGNEGIGGSSPQSYVGSINYEDGSSVFSAAAISSNPVSRSLPRRTYTEFDLLYGIALDRVLSHYGGASEQFHASLSAGIGISNYQTNWRNFGRGRPPFDSTYFLLPQNTSQFSLGLPIQLQAIYEPFRYVGIGALLFYTISTFQPSYGGAVVIEVRY
jgi:hypothetical protein